MLDNQRLRSSNGQDDSSEDRANNSQNSPPAISLPKGGGAIRGIGEKFAANPVTGTGSMTVPIATSPGRSGFGPQISLSYDSGSGNGPFGFGWSLSLPSITRKTDKGLPQYLAGEESDVFILSGAEDLAPEFKKDGAGNWVIENGQHVIREQPHTVDGVTYTVRRYRPRIEGLFARIERWTNPATGEIHWRSITRDNVTTLYGKDNRSRIFDPADPNPQHPTRIFSWLICQSYDDKGNAIVYEYQNEDSQRIFEDQQGQSVALAHERNRDETSRSANRYLKRIKYGNRRPNRDATTWQATDVAQLPTETWMFEVVFDYGEGHYVEDAPDAQGRVFAQAQIDPPAGAHWPVRQDPFSSYRAGFEVRTYRLCRRVLMFHHLPDLSSGAKGYEGLVRSTDFTYSHQQAPTSARNPVYTFLREVTQAGYKREGSGYLKRRLPPVEFEYSQPIVQDTLEEVDAESLENLPTGLDGATYQWTDLHGEGIPGILTEQGGAWFYKRNLSPINEKPGNGASHVEAKFAPIELVAAKPNLALADGAQFMDLAGDGQLDLVIMDGPAPGLYEHDGDENWQPFRPFTARLNRDTRDPNLKFVDLNGDGHADVLISEADAFVWHASLAEAGFGPARRVHQALDEEKGPRLVFADGAQSIYLADLSGDGLTDLARIRNGEVCYWPNLGYGRFGAKVTMDHAPHFDHPDQFDPRRIRLADIDGTGTTDILYLHRDGVRLYFNQSGNSWSKPQPLDVFPRVDDLASIMPTDLLGNGTACLVWSSSLPGDAHQPMRYVNLMGGQKPHLLVKTVNNLGAETRVQYAPSTKFYLQDKQAGKPWITRLPFPVHVVERVETYDHISGNRFVTRYTYHHGYFDGIEREFRGFGRVEQTDTEEFTALSNSDQFPTGDNIDPASHVPPVLTKTWFHTGAYLQGDYISRQFEAEYYREPGLSNDAFSAQLLPDTVLPPDLTLEETREAVRALKGAMLRREVYALDNTPQAAHPYTVSERSQKLKLIQPREDNRHAVFYVCSCNTLDFHYERNPDDPRVTHQMSLEVDAFGNVLRAAAIGYGRRQPDPALAPQDQAKQTQLLITCMENDFTNPIDQPDDYRPPLPCESRSFELTGLSLNAGSRFDFATVDNAVQTAFEISYESEPDGFSLQKRLIEHVRALYRQNDLAALLPLGEVESLALPGESYQLAFTPGLLAQVYQRDDQSLLSDPAAVLGDQAADRGGYLVSQILKATGNFPATDSDDHWWVPSGHVFYDINADTENPAATASQELTEARQHFFLPRKVTDPFGHSSTVDYGYDLLIIRTKDPVDNTVLAVNNYRVLQPELVTDPNHNRTAIAFDALGMVVATAVMGKEGENLGDLLEDFDADPPLADLQAFIADPQAQAGSLLGKASSRIVYDLGRYQRAAQPPVAAALARETHFHDPLLADGLKIQFSFAYSDGFGREIQQKIQAEAGDAPQRQTDLLLATGDIRPGELVRDAQGELQQANTPRRWVGSGRTVFNNKGKPVRQYEPFFSATHLYEPERDMTDTGVSPVLFYDPVERVIATLHPNHTYEKVLFDPWGQVSYDVNDTDAAQGPETGDPRTDPDIQGFVAPYFAAVPAGWQTWHAQRSGGALGPQEQAAASKAAVHTNTPTTVHFDTLGRPFLTVALNRFERKKPDNTIEVIEEPPYHTRVELDIEGNQRAVRDALKKAFDAQGNETVDELGRIVMRYDYDMLGNRIHQDSMEAGERWMLNDVTGQPIRVWDSRGHNFVTAYDTLRRPVQQFVRGTTADSDPRTLNRDRLVDKIEYGEGQDNDVALSLRTRIYRHSDSAGVVTNAALNPITNQMEAYDFKGNLLRSSRQLVSDYTDVPDWLLNPQLDEESFTGSTRYDALNRPTQAIAPRSDQRHARRNVIQPVYNEANLLERLDVWLDHPTEPTGLLDAAAVSPSPVGVNNIDYNARGQRLRIEYKNGAATQYEYDSETFRLTRLTTTRPPNLNGLATRLFKQPAIVQDLRYTYDPVGNITHIADEALPTLFHDNQEVEPVCQYTYDAVYRLIEAKGREHIDQSAFMFNPPNGNYRDYPLVGAAQLNNPQAVRSYTELYEYDAVGNFEKMIHQAGNGSWTRDYGYDETSLIEDGTSSTLVKTSNRLSRTTIGNGNPITESYAYDPHGSMTQMLHLSLMQWDYRDQLIATSKQVVINGGTPETTYYVYDAAGQRTRKVTENQNGTRVKERLYLGGFEIYREYSGNGNTVTLERETLHVMDDQQRIALVETKTFERGLLPRVRDFFSPPRPLIRYQLGNHLGSASLELDEQAQIISYEEYYPYGSTSHQAGRSQVEVQLKRYRFTGMERDEESGFNYHRARYFVPWIGKWASVDPASLLGGINVYRYSKNNPVGLVDSQGLAPEKPEAIVRKISELHKQRETTRHQLQQVNSELERASTSHMELKASYLANEAELYPREQRYGKALLKAQEKQISKLLRQSKSLTLQHAKLEKAIEKNISSLPSDEWVAEGLEAAGEKEAAKAVRTEIEEIVDPDRAVDRKFENLEDPAEPVRRTPGSGGPGNANSADPTKITKEELSGGGKEGTAPPGRSGQFVKGAIAGVLSTIVIKLFFERELPSGKELIESAVPLVDLAQAKSHDETVRPILLYFAGPQLAKVATTPAGLIMTVGAITIIVTTPGRMRNIEAHKRAGLYYRMDYVGSTVRRDLNKVMP